MKHFNFNQLGACILDNDAFCAAYVLCPESFGIGEIVTIGRAKRIKAVYVESPRMTDESEFALLGNFSGSTGDKCVQYVPKVNGYFLFLTTF